MKTLHFSITIDAPRERVWDTMLGPETYRVWTAPFAEGSYFEGSWAKGEKIHFLAPSGDGMSSVIDENRPYEFVSIRHVGMIMNGIEDTESESVKQWAPLFENYTLTTQGSSTKVDVDLDVTSDFEADMQTMWPKALDVLKAICEKTSEASGKP